MSYSACALLRLITCLLPLSTSSAAQTQQPPVSAIPPATHTPLAFSGANIVSAQLAQPVLNATVLVKNGRIVALQPADAAIPAEYQRLDVSGKWLLPGLIDGHVHLAQSGGAFTRPDIIAAEAVLPYQQDQLQLATALPQLLQTYVMLGVTAVFDMGGPAARLPLYQQLSQNPTMPAIYAAAQLLAPMAVPPLSPHDGATFSQTTSAAQALALTTAQLQQPAAVLKLVWSHETGLNSEQLTLLYADAIALAKAHGRVVAVHVEELAAAKAAIIAGADILVHGVVTEPLDSEFIQLALKHQVSYMPTLTAYRHYKDIFLQRLSFSKLEQQMADPGVLESFALLKQHSTKTGQLFQLLSHYSQFIDAPATSRAQLSAEVQDIVAQLGRVFSNASSGIQQQNLQQALAGGLNVAFGTDAGNPGTLHGLAIIREMQAWRDAGVSNWQIFRAMTLGNARALRLDATIGSISVGKQANFIILPQNPLAADYRFALPERVVQRGELLNFTTADHVVTSSKEAL